MQAMNQSLSMLSLFKQHVAEMTADSQTQYNHLVKAGDKLYIVHDKVIEKMAYAYREQGDNVGLFRKQAHRWLTQSLNPEEQYAVEQFLIQLDELEKITQRVGGLIAGMRQQPIEKSSTTHYATGKNQ